MSTSEPEISEIVPTFEAMPLSDEVRQALVEMSYEQPTPVQWAVWEPAVAGKDVVVQARTGTGKTASFGLPILDRLVRRSNKTPQALILCPTRELALQVSRELDKLGSHTDITTFPIYGGAPMERQVQAIAAGVQVICGTPGRVLDHLRRGTLKADGIKTLVLDEADEMLSMGFERELTAIIEHLPKERQTLLFSATVPPDIERMARTRLHDPEFVILSSDQVGALEIDHFVYWVVQDKIGALLQVLEIEDPESAIVFCNTREQTEVTATRLQREGFEADWLNGDLPQNEREKVMRRTREGRLRFLVATDVAARGIDISHLTHVINYDFPQDAESYVHRTGRTGRAGRTGTAISLVTPQEVGGLYILRLTYKIRPIERQLPSVTEQRTRLETDIVQGLAQLFAPKAVDSEYRALARRLLTHDAAEQILAGLLHDHLAAHPDMSELSQSRRRARTPDPIREEPRDERRGRRGRHKDGGRERRDEEPRPAEVQSGETRSARPRGEEATPEDATAKPARPSKPSRARASRPGGAERDRPSRPDRSRKPSEPVEVTAEAPVSVPEPAVVEAVVVEERAPSRASGVDAPVGRRRRRARTAPSTGASAESEGDIDRDDAEDEPRVVMTDVVRSGGSSDEPEEDDDGGGAATPDTIELHVDVGRRDGAQVRVLKSILADGGVPPEAVHRIRVRDRYTFVEVSRELADAALEAFSGAQLGDRTLKASVSDRSGNG